MDFYFSEHFLDDLVYEYDIMNFWCKKSYEIEFILQIYYTWMWSKNELHLGFCSTVFHNLFIID